MKTNLFAIFIIVALGSCSERIRVFTDKDATREISGLSSFSWNDIKNLETAHDPLYYNELNDKRIKTEVNTQLQSRGFRLEQHGADLLVHYHIVINNETVNRDMANFYHGARWLETYENSYTVQEGTLIIDLMDAKTGELLWRGYAISILDNYRPDISEKVIREAIAKIFAEFPRATK